MRAFGAAAKYVFPIVSVGVLAVIVPGASTNPNETTISEPTKLVAKSHVMVEMLAAPPSVKLPSRNEMPNCQS